jgi:hypothetical protein
MALGCFNRPWAKWGICSARGHQSRRFNLAGLLTRTKAEPMIGSDATPEYLEALKKKIAARGLKANLGTIYTRHDVPQDEAVLDLHKQIDHAKRLDLEYLMSFGVDRPQDYDLYYKLAAEASAYVPRARPCLCSNLMGGSGAEETCVASRGSTIPTSALVRRSNIIHYTGKTPSPNSNRSPNMSAGSAPKIARK